jgi:glycosyltransferase involved in cell wall biosynthesis
LVPRKSILEFLKALALRIDERDEFSIDVVGRMDSDPDYARKCVEFVQGYDGLQRSVRMNGAVPHARMSEFYGRASALISASEMETFGMALQEARGYGLPILALDGGYARHHFTDQENGRLFYAIPALAAGFLQLVRDEHAMRALFERAQIREAREDDSDYTWDAAATRLLQQLERCFGSSAEC